VVVNRVRLVGLAFNRYARSWLARLGSTARNDVTAALVGIAGAFIGFHISLTLAAYALRHGRGRRADCPMALARTLTLLSRLFWQLRRTASFHLIRNADVWRPADDRWRCAKRALTRSISFSVHDRRSPPGIVARRDWRRRNHETQTVGRSSHNDRVRAVGYDGIVVGQAAGFATDALAADVPWIVLVASKLCP
jgi:hypothetical protein